MLQNAAAPTGLKDAKEPSGIALYDDVKTRIRSGELKPGDRIVNSRELMSRFGISYRATLLAMQRLEAEGYVVRKPGSGTYVNGLPTHVKLGAHTKTILVISSAFDIGELFLRPLVEALEEELSAMECTHSVVTCPQGHVGEFLVPGEADAFVWVCPGPQPYRFPEIPKVPLVLVAQDTVMAWPQATGYDIVTADHVQGGTVAGAYLKEVGCKRPVVVGVWYERERFGRVSPYTAPRLEGFQTGWGRTLPQDHIFLAKSYHAASGAEATPKVLAMDPLPDAIFATSDDLAAGICHALIGHGIYPGRDIKLVGFDAQPPYYRGDPLLTTVEVPLQKLGKTAAVMALERADKPEAIARKVSFACRLRKGATG